MNDYKKYALIALVAVAVIVAAVAAIVVSSKRAEVAAAMAEKAASDEARARSERKTAESNERAAANQKAAKDAEAKAAEDNRKTAEAEREAERLAVERADLELKAETKRLVANEAEAAIKHDEAEAERLRNDTATNETAKVEAEARAKEAVAKTAADNLKAKEIEKALAEDRKTRYEAWENDLLTLASELRDKERELEERERALAPERTITDLLGGDMEDTVFDENGNVCKKPKVAYRAEDDPKLPRSSRELAKAERELDEMASNETARVRAAIVTPLEKEYAQARKEDRVLDANYIADAIKLLYPDWEEPKGTEGTKETEQDLNNERQQ